MYSTLLMSRLATAVVLCLQCYALCCTLLALRSAMRYAMRYVYARYAIHVLLLYAMLCHTAQHLYTTCYTQWLCDGQIPNDAMNQLRQVQNQVVKGNH
jgi:hypothetical protein